MNGLLGLPLGRASDLVHCGGQGGASVNDALDRGARKFRALGEFVLRPPLAVEYRLDFLSGCHGREDMVCVASAQRGDYGKLQNIKTGIVARAQRKCSRFEPSTNNETP